MAGSVNKVILVGNLGRDPEVAPLAGDRCVANMSVATSTRWRDRDTGEMKENTQWHRVAIFNQPTVKYVETYLKKGDKVYIEGELRTRTYEKNGEQQYITEVVVQPYGGQVVGLSQNVGRRSTPDPAAPVRSLAEEMDDEIPF